MDLAKIKKESQATVPAAPMEQLGLKPGDYLEFVLETVPFSHFPLFSFFLFSFFFLETIQQSFSCLPLLAFGV